MDYKQAVKDKKRDVKALEERMDADRDLVNLAAYTLNDVDNHKIPHAISVTLNDPAVFAANVESSLGNATEQVVVESDDKNVDTAYIEEFVRAALGDANTRQISQGRWALNPFFDQQTCRRGRAGARCLFRIEEDKLIADIVPWDTRYMYYEVGPKGFAWQAYETTRSKGMILAEYPDATVNGKSGEVLDIWSPEHNEVHVDGQLVLEQPHTYGVTPVCFQMVPLGSMLADKDSMQHQGESIFFLIRDLHPELNRLVSIIQSLNVKALDAALQLKSQAGTGLLNPPSHDEVTAPDAVIPMDIGGGLEPVPYGDIKQSAILLHSIIETRVQRGSLSNLDLGIMGNQPWSAVALVEIGEGRDQVFLPRLGARGLLKQQLAHMAIEQVQNLGVSTVELGPRGHRRSFNVAKLEGEYEVTFKYFIKSPKVDIARFSMAAAAGDLIPDKAKRRDILQREDPDEDERQLRWEEAEMLSPAIKIDRTIRNLLEMAKRGDKDAAYEAEILSAEMGVNLQQMLAGSAAQIPTPGKAQEPQPLVPLLPEGRPTSGQKSADLQATPKQEEGGE